MTWFQYFLFSIVFYWCFIGLIKGLCVWDSGEFEDEDSKKQQFVAQICYGPVVWLWLVVLNLIFTPVYFLILKPIFRISDFVWEKLE